MKKAGRGRSLVFISISGLAMLGAAGFAEAQPLPRLDQSVAPRAPAAVTPGPDCGPDGGPVVRRLPTVPALVTPIDPLIVQRLHAQRAALSSRDDDAADSETSSASPAPTVAAARGKIVSLGSARMALSSVPTATGRAVAAALRPRQRAQSRAPVAPATAVQQTATPRAVRVATSAAPARREAARAHQVAAPSPQPERTSGRSVAERRGAAPVERSSVRARKISRARSGVRRSNRNKGKRIEFRFNARASASVSWSSGERRPQTRTEWSVERTRSSRKTARSARRERRRSVLRVSDLGLRARPCWMPIARDGSRPTGNVRLARSASFRRGLQVKRGLRVQI